ncbi:hypothetical protein GGX14DRAFT_696376 [Mycena pura]|uniref:Uncharacterized protein n=1 Tax=Mycena pura TaxID=153505 RepID=A0AAD6YIQ8_9AGAR|nr:hypothetical protein GGX14DRAFT_696376 [Mycena pura]
MAGKRKLKRVPHALHSELSEYASLLRALRANDTLDVAKHITRAPPPPTKRHKPQPSSGDIVVPVPPATDVGEGSSTLVGTEPPKPKSTDPPKPKPTRDTWTRWPLLAADVHVPEWGLDDEIAALVRQCLQTTAADEDVDDAEPPSYLPHLTHSASAFLSSVLALLAHHTPARPQSMQNRLNPINWKTVLDVVASCGDVDAATIASVQARMEVIYGPYESPAMSRLKARAAAKSRTAAALQEADDALMMLVRPQGKTEPMEDEDGPDD